MKTSIKNKLCRIQYFPVSFFSVILGLGGFTIALQKVEELLEMSFQISLFVLCSTAILFIIIALLYGYKMVTYPNDVRAEFLHPVKINFFPTFSISLLLLSISLLHIYPSISELLWIVGSIIHFIFTLLILSIWMQHTHFDITHINPSWFIPVVGNILVPVAGHVHASPEISWFFFSVGFIFWIALFTIFFYRVIFHAPLAQKLYPTLFILIAPPAIGFISYVKLTGEADVFARILYYIAFFLATLLVFQARVFVKIKFYLSWWAYSFPTAAITIASILMYHMTGYRFFFFVALCFSICLTILILLLAILTIRAVVRKEICVEESA